MWQLHICILERLKCRLVFKYKALPGRTNPTRHTWQHSHSLLCVVANAKSPFVHSQNKCTLGTQRDTPRCLVGLFTWTPRALVGFSVCATLPQQQRDLLWTEGIHELRLKFFLQEFRYIHKNDSKGFPHCQSYCNLIDSSLDWNKHTQSYTHTCIINESSVGICLVLLSSFCLAKSPPHKS